MTLGRIIIRGLKHVLLPVLCAVLLAGSAAAETYVNISGEGFDCMYYQCTLPDGRIVLSGWKAASGNYQDSRARILCLNGDMTVSWEYLDPSKGHCGFTDVAVLKDGTLGAVLENAPNQALKERTLKFFTPDGQPTGKETDLTVEDSIIVGKSASCLWMFWFDADGKTYDEFLDWDGNTLLRYAEKGPIGGGSRMIEEEDGLVFAGSEPGEGTAAQIMKIDFRGNLLWKTTIPPKVQGAEGANLAEFMKTEDGGYLARQVEYGEQISGSIKMVKFETDGRIQWLNGTAFEAFPDSWVGGWTEYKGGIVAEMIEEGYDDSLNGGLRTYLWMDGKGNALGTTELHMDDVLPKREDQKQRLIGDHTLIPAGDGLWGLGLCEIQNDDPVQTLDSEDNYLLKIPER